MKKAIKFMLSLLAGILLGICLVLLGTILITGKSPETIINILSRADIIDIIKSCTISLVAFFIVLVLQTIIHEAGHLIFGLLSGYKFVSFRIFNITLTRKDGHFAIHRYSIAGTGGQCLLLPPDRPTDEIPYMLYNAGGIIINFITAVTAIITLILCRDINIFIFHILVFTAIIGLLFTLLNGIPMKINGITNDGYDILLFCRNKLSYIFFINQLRINAMVQNGCRPKDIPEELFDIHGNIDTTDPIQSSAIVYRATRLLDIGDIAAANSILNNMLINKEKMLGLIVNEAQCELLFTQLILGNIEEAHNIYTKELKKYIIAYSKTMSSKQRILHAIALFIDKDPDKAHHIYNTLKSNRTKYMMQGEVAMDIALMEKAEALAKEHTNK